MARTCAVLGGSVPEQSFLMRQLPKMTRPIEEVAALTEGNGARPGPYLFQPQVRMQAKE